MFARPLGKVVSEGSSLHLTVFLPAFLPPREIALIFGCRGPISASRHHSCNVSPSKRNRSHLWMQRPRLCISTSLFQRFSLQEKSLSSLDAEAPSLHLNIILPAFLPQREIALIFGCRGPISASRLCSSRDSHSHSRRSETPCPQASRRSDSEEKDSAAAAPAPRESLLRERVGRVPEKACYGTISPSRCATKPPAFLGRSLSGSQ